MILPRGVLTAQPGDPPTSTSCPRRGLRREAGEGAGPGCSAHLDQVRRLPSPTLGAAVLIVIDDPNSARVASDAENRRQ